MGRSIPDFMGVVVADEPAASKREIAEHSVLALNDSMMAFYEVSLHKFIGNVRAQSPIILAMFTGQGGRMTLFRPGHEPEEAPPVPLKYQIFKSVGHSTLAIYEILAPYLTNASANQLWRAPLETYLTQHRSALEGLDALDVTDEERAVLRTVLELNVAFMDECLAKGDYDFAALEAYTRSTVPFTFKAIGVSSGLQVEHWVEVVEKWQKELGDLWDKTYAVTNTLYVARQNNILYTVLAQFMGKEAIGDRLLLVETPEFETTPEKLMDVLGRIIADRSLGEMFFKDYFLMDVELLGGGAREAIEREMKKRGREPLLPNVAPFHSHDWPWKTGSDNGEGPGTLADAAFGCPMSYSLKD